MNTPIELNEILAIIGEQEVTIRKLRQQISVLNNKIKELEKEDESELRDNKEDNS